ncbi:hypothetical protein [Wenzhouxiangella sediminis]|jgi:hypothetical protein|uniref:Uncharacterized protein n=1 Tax=Wenzhouxiangella sediminis TaxID=1792836 RepID=A0A3E1KD19_9GAMM|nr:hypothetical protein [Wenzhouxiangella sediminis]RFF32818.1 hypothetical protein DZC52_00335 [Wenzhouxiangella sediminis]
MKYLSTLISAAALAALCQFAVAANGEPAKARVVGGPPDPVQYLYEVELTAINGERIIPREMLTLEPGDYTLTARIPAQVTEPAVGQRKRRWDRHVDFDITLEPGRDYSVRVKWNRSSLEKPYELLIEEMD